MRAALLIVVLSAASCGDGGGARLVSADVGGPTSESCVAPDTAAGRVTTWKVREGDSLRRIARRVYGDEDLWKAIRDANPDKVGRDDSIRVGAVLTIPRDGI